jgi:hypothetical protein
LNRTHCTIYNVRVEYYKSMGESDLKTFSKLVFINFPAIRFDRPNEMVVVCCTVCYFEQHKVWVKYRGIQRKRLENICKIVKKIGCMEFGHVNI